MLFILPTADGCDSKKNDRNTKASFHQILNIFTLMIEARAAENLSYEQAYFVEEVYSHEILF